MTTHYKRKVCAYLASRWGADTPCDVAALLLRLRPESVGMSTCPEMAAIHATRGYLQVLVQSHRTDSRDLGPLRMGKPSSEQ